MPTAEELASSLHPLEILVIRTLGNRTLDEETLDREAAAREGPEALSSGRLAMALGWLLAKGLIEKVSEETRSIVSLTDQGRIQVQEGTPERRILRALGEGRALTVRTLASDLSLDPEDVSGAVGTLKDRGLIRIVAGGRLELTRPNPADPELERVEALLARLAPGPIDLQELSPQEREIVGGLHRKRGRRGALRVDERVRRTYRGTALFEAVREHLGSDGGVREVSRLTPEMLKDGSWRQVSFRRYSLSIPPPRLLPGRAHPYREFLDRVRRTLVAMGFREMRGPLVETEFWNMDALFMPQFHPARDIHDVYYVKSEAAGQVPEDLLERVAAAHRDGGRTGSRGWRYPFDPQRSHRLILRSQGTAVSTRTLAAGAEIPGRYFSVARCFRYDQADATHAVDFFQVEGIALGPEITLRTLLGLLRVMAREVARSSEVKFTPAYFPFTEPSVELHVRHPELGWMELGGAGLFRPEVTHPLGVEVPVIAWGLGVDRMAMIALGIKDIRDLFSADLDLLRSRTLR